MQHSLSDGQQAIAHRHRVADLDVYTRDGAGLECTDFSFHFHGFEDDHQIALLNRLTGLYEHLEDIACQRCQLRLTSASGRCRSGCSCCARSVTDRLESLDVATFVDLYHVRLAVDLDGVKLGYARFAWRLLVAG